MWSFAALSQIVAALVLACVAFLFDAPALAAQRTFVSSSGVDTNACSLAAPCRSFAAATSHTDVDGEIVVLDSGGYGSVTIDRSLAISAPSGVYAGISATAGTTAVDIVSGATNVILRGLTINGQESNSTGISIGTTSRVHIERCAISNIGGGITITAPAWVFIEDTSLQQTGGIFAENVHAFISINRVRLERSLGSGVRVRNGPEVAISNSLISITGGNGVIVESFDGASTTIATVSDTQIRFSNDGISATAMGAGSTVRLDVVRSTISSSGFEGILAVADTGTLVGAVSDSLITRNGSEGILGSGAGVALTISGNTVSNSAGGVIATSGALIRTLQNNSIRGNFISDASGLTPVGGN